MICDHEYTCGLYLRRILSQDLSSYSDRCFLNNTKKDHVVEIRERMSELMGTIVRRSACYEFIYPDGKIRCDSVYIEPPEAGSPSELIDYSGALSSVLRLQIT